MAMAHQTSNYYCIKYYLYPSYDIGWGTGTRRNDSIRDNGKAPGPEGLTQELIKYGPDFVWAIGLHF